MILAPESDLFEVVQESCVLLEVVLDCLDARAGPVVHPGLGEVFLDDVEHATLFHDGPMIEPRPVGVMSRSAHLFGP